MAKLTELVERQNKIWTRMQEIQSEADGAEWTAELRTNWDKADGDLREVSSDIERAQRAAELEAVDYRQVVQTSPEERETPETDAAERRTAEYEDAFGGFLRRGLDRLRPEQRDLMMANFQQEDRAQATSPNSAGGFLIPAGYRNVLAEAVKSYGGIYQHANVITTSTGNSLQWPTNDDTANEGIELAENPSSHPEQDVTFGNRTIGAYTYTSKLVLVSLQLLQDSAFDLDTWLPRKLGERIGRVYARRFISGTGTGQPTGIATTAATGVTAAPAALTYDNFIDLEHSIDPAYRAGGNCRFILTDATLAVTRKLKDGEGRPLWNPVPVAGQPATINGVPYSIDHGMAGVGAENKSVLFGDFKAGYLIREVLDVQMVRLAERYAEKLQVGFFAFSRMDAKPDDPAAVRALVHAES